jgi:hypothetical protein
MGFKETARARLPGRTRSSRLDRRPARRADLRLVHGVREQAEVLVGVSDRRGAVQVTAKKSASLSALMKMCRWALRSWNSEVVAERGAPAMKRSGLAPRQETPSSMN